MKRRGEVKAGVEPEKKKIVNHPINHCDPHLKPIVITALNSGMRRGEVLGLKWDQVDLKHGFILLDITKNGERREIPINSTLRATLLSQQRMLDVPHVFYDTATG
jgi:integrase